ncbi:MAG: Fe-Mn family superoxide dismutase [Pseudomonadales bacterium]|nr:Fe-Mn family superoxide dismutase [Pseudomonadales bacterium]
MTNHTKRTFLKSAALGAMALPALASMPAWGQQRAQVPDAFQSNLELKPLPFDPSQLDGLSEGLILSHWQNNYGGSVRALNTIKQRLQTALADDDLPAFVYNDLKREHLMRTGSVVLHEYYFDNMAAPGSRDGELDRELARAFGSTQNWEKEFRRIGAGLGGGSGWVMLAWNVHAQTLENYWMWDHMHAPAASIPLLVMDMYEHSYHMDFGAATGQYLDAFFRNINWAVVAERLGRAVEGRV